MKIIDLINEGKWASDFDRYRKMGQSPTQLATHVAKKAVGAATGNDKTGSARPQARNSLGDTSEIKSIIDQVINGQQLDSRSLQALKQFRRKL
jgi:hypothetical protein